MNKTAKISLVSALVCLLFTLLFFLFDLKELLGFPIILTFAFLSITIRYSDTYKSLSFTIVVFAAVALAMFYPEFFLNIGTFKFKSLIVPLLQIIMFGMGTSMSLKDFQSVINTPKGVLIGLICQFTIMPVLGFSIAYLFGFSSEIAAGIVLIGCCPSGLASNVMVYLAKANLALSITLTTISTLLAPFITPMLMELLAGEFIPIDILTMMLSIVKMVILPIVAGLIFNKIFHGKLPWLDRIMPQISMTAIAFIIIIIVAAGRDKLLEIGLLLIGAAILHNISGYFFGHWGCKLFKLPESDCRTIAIEVGMQNGGIASGIALEIGKVSTVGLPAAIFGPWMNISGSAIASWWKDKPSNPNNPEQEIL